MSAADLLRVVEQLEEAGVAVWLDGGWGVDALLGVQTREHDDLDLVAELSYSERIVETLRGLGYDLVAGAPPRSYVLVDSVGRQVDVHPVLFVEGGGLYETDVGRHWLYPAQGFTGRGRVCGRQVRCLSPEVQVLVHAGYEFTEKDYRELFLLRERFEVDVPDEVLESVLAAGTRLRAAGGE
jgi:lincosamide nucleotidyltransferase A/C/D/E